MVVPGSMLSDLQSLVPGGVSTGVSLAEISRWRVGGSADVIVRPVTVAQVQGLRQYFHRNGIHHVVIGLTSNLLFDDRGLRVPCIQVGSGLGQIHVQDRRVTAQAGAWVPGLARMIQKWGLGGAEHICGIPGTIGGLVCMNGGSLRKNIGSSVADVTSIDASGRVRVRTAAECQFAYRQSVFQKNGEVIVEVRLDLDTCANAQTVRQSMLRILSDRRRKFPRSQPNCGSVFKSNPGLYAAFGPPGKVIEMLGLKGTRFGGAQVSTVHANFVVNSGGATSVDIVTLIGTIRTEVQGRTGFLLDSEVIAVDPMGSFRPVSEIC